MIIQNGGFGAGPPLRTFLAKTDPVVMKLPKTVKMFWVWRKTLPAVKEGRAGSVRSVRKRRRCPRIFETMIGTGDSDARGFLARCKAGLSGFSRVICTEPGGNNRMHTSH